MNILKPPPRPPTIESRAFLLLLVVVTLAFGLILQPFYGGVFWGMVLAILFNPLYRRILRSTRQRPTLAALATMSLVIVIVVLPLTFIVTALVQETAAVFQRIQSGELNFATMLQQIFDALPESVVRVLDRFQLGSLAALLREVSALVTKGSQAIAAQVLNIGQNTFDFMVGFVIMLYLLFFLLRDGSALSKRIKDAIPLAPEHKSELFSKFATVVRATVKGNILVAMAQGALGGMIFWFLGIPGAVLWAVVMAVLSLLPAVGAGLVWGPVAIYFLSTGAVWQGTVLVAYGICVIGLVDNILRPILVGKDTKMPDYLVLLSTLGGLAVFGLNGFVIGPVIAAMFMAVWGIFSPPRTGSGYQL